MVLDKNKVRGVVGGGRKLSIFAMFLCLAIFVSCFSFIYGYAMVCCYCYAVYAIYGDWLVDWLDL